MLFYRELLEGQKEHKRKLHLIQQRNKKQEIPWEDSEIGRINIKIKALLALKEAAAAARREKEVQLGGVVAQTVKNMRKERLALSAKVKK